MNATDFDLQRSDDEAFEIFDLQPLELTDGQTLTLSVVASDDNRMPGPAVTPTPGPRAVQPRQSAEAIDLLGTAGAPVLKRLAPALGGLLLRVLVVRRLLR